LEDENSVDKKFQKELNSGVAALVLLDILNRAEQPMYGYQIANMIGESKQDVSFIKQGTFYPVLHSLENNGLLSSEVEPSISGPPRRYYRITTEGSQTVERWKVIWDATKNFADSILRS
jgi:PadR family transcriptional regulator PadR